jgi:hypothetical protein
MERLGLVVHGLAHAYESRFGIARGPQRQQPVHTGIVVNNFISFDGSLRLCIDYRGVNEVTCKDAYPLPLVDDTIDELKDANFYTHMDLASGF